MLYSTLNQTIFLVSDVDTVQSCTDKLRSATTTHNCYDTSRAIFCDTSATYMKLSDVDKFDVEN